MFNKELAGPAVVGLLQRRDTSSNLGHAGHLTKVSLNDPEGRVKFVRYLHDLCIALD